LNTSENIAWKISIDTGGTFTDCLAIDPDGIKSRIKVLSSARLRGRITGQLMGCTYTFDAPWAFDGTLLANYCFSIRGVERHAVLVSLNQGLKQLVLDQDFGAVSDVDFEIFSGEEAPVLAARLITGTPLSETLPPIDMRLGTTRGTNALLERKGAKTLLVVTRGFKDLLYIGTQQRPSLFQLDIPEPALLYSEVLEVDERLDAGGNVVHALPEIDLRKTIGGKYDAVAISLLHGSQNDAHEVALTSQFKQEGTRYVSTSSQLSPFSHYLRRTQTAVVNAYLDPVLDNYLQNIRHSIPEGRLKIMTSTGSLSELSGFSAKDSLLSGPAGGMVAATNTARRFGFSKVLTFDMGGTSTDVARITGQPELKYITVIDGIEFHNPTLDIETVAAGGGSVCWFDGFTLQVGPESAGAAPGPACYGAGGPLTITDVNLLLGKMDPGKFGIPIRYAAALDALQNLREMIYQQTGNQLSELEILTGLEKITNEKMADAIRKISIEKGISPQDHALVTFGGAGGLHGCQLAELLDIRHVIIPYDAGLFSAAGIGEALISTIVSKQVLLPWEEAASHLEIWRDVLLAKAKEAIENQGVTAHELVFCKVFLRLAGQENTLEIPYNGAQTIIEFEQVYRNQFGYYPSEAVVELESVRLKVQEKPRFSAPDPVLEKGRIIEAFRSVSWNQLPEGLMGSSCAGLYEWDVLSAGDEIHGPAILLNRTSTSYIPEGWRLVIQANHDAVAFRSLASEAATGEQSEEVALQLFTNRFAAIAEQMGVQLQRTAFSVNVKERLDFSCALLDASGDLIVNAQHIPVHLGSMGICGRLVLAQIAIGPGDVVITNHPKYGGSHLPDITLISGVFTDDNICIGYVINRAHHAEIGGKTPGSMPPDATCLAEEGVVILPRYLVKGGVFQWDDIRSLFTESPYPTRNFLSNEADIVAALSSLRKGSEQLLKLVSVHGVAQVEKYMNRLKTTALIQLEQKLVPLRGKVFQATEHMDDGHRIQVAITIQEGKQIFDFTGTTAVHPNNLNANISIIYSAILYVLRLLAAKEIPLNDGLMKNTEIILPENSFLNPDFSDDPLRCPAVVGGNTEVSQRLVDTLLKAFGVVACSQGTMNNFLFGNKNFGYYETIGGGAGAGQGFDGRSAVHQHMTNTRITDPEQLERKYPVRLLEFGIRKGSGGFGQFRGGDGIVRSIQFLEPLQVTLLGQHRNEAPYGLQGGSPGLCGKHTLTSSNTTSVLSGICSFEVIPGDILTIETPGGGGFGS
jgi:5-oxoprolinase (ATP-hydrolysing)